MCEAAAALHGTVTNLLFQQHPPPPCCMHTQVAKRELALECNYTYEAAAQQRFRDLVAGDEELAKLFYVPQVGGSWPRARVQHVFLAVHAWLLL